MVLYKKYLAFLKGVSHDPVGKLGVVLTTSALGVFLILELARILDVIRNAYVGLITYLAFPLIFIIGLILIPIGWQRLKRNTGKTGADLLATVFDEQDTRLGPYGSNLFQTILLLTIINAVFLGFLATRMLSFMDEPHFCGTACHSVMDPEWQTYQASPHANVKCVDCHVGEGADALVESKINGIWQMISVTFDLYEKPIPTPVHNLRPARETCETCHWPAKFYGKQLKTIVSYDNNQMLTPSYTTLSIKIDTRIDEPNPGVHWHIDDKIKVYYATIDDKRQKILWVEVERLDGSRDKFFNRKSVAQREDKLKIREMDCVDCHNRATHIYQDPVRAVDDLLSRGIIPPGIPFIKREAVAAIKIKSSDKEIGLNLVEQHLVQFYRDNYPDILNSRSVDIDKTVHELQKVYARNIHPQMNIRWGVYPSNLGHKSNGGCFRCHTPDMINDDGKAVSYDCTLCHFILAYESSHPFQFLQEPDSTNLENKMQEYLLDEFMHSY
ncbi:MAG: NapC/NirT family cytochrome c [Candidatus Marinimicrobia bacterium]|nr:NapC/NirT family cytochrome c [Candidatus Neomarinimicrobiota bacterium]